MRCRDVAEPADLQFHRCVGHRPTRVDLKRHHGRFGTNTGQFAPSEPRVLTRLGKKRIITLHHLIYIIEIRLFIHLGSNTSWNFRFACCEDLSQLSISSCHSLPPKKAQDRWRRAMLAAPWSYITVDGNTHEVHTHRSTNLKACLTSQQKHRGEIPRMMPPSQRHRAPRADLVCFIDRVAHLQ